MTDDNVHPLNPDEFMARLRAEQDQVRAENAQGITALADALARLRGELLSRGVPAPEAFVLVRDFARALFMQGVQFLEHEDDE